ncbi:MAG: GNAT family N-acetyltransferase [Peptoniphilaceae bacterium]|nr:GNAT family N-acetyltransferase [Peptoniphilaceae bacterium]MDD7383852.1 GNAT family N-acetyltransferase [Peptoniphilaceae bacterium]MDY3738145.1 GNAT family N-acetyltransferase [Peptoniphilaceae bacterium]MDY6018116.1 GNAT family N-acetyltransferase [Anaerococcus sp.]
MNKENSKYIESRRLNFKWFIEKDYKKIGWIKELNINENEFKNSAKLGKKFGNYEWQIFEKKSSESIGVIKAIEVDEKNEKIKLYIYIQKNKRNRGYATETIETITDFFMTEIFAKSIEFNCDVNNEAFKSVMEKTKYKLISKNENSLTYEITNIAFMNYFAVFGDIYI